MAPERQSPEKVFGGNEEVEPAVFLDGGGEAAGIDEGGAYGRAAGKGKGFDFPTDFGFDFLADVFAALDFDDAEGFLRLQEEVDLDAGPVLDGLPEIGGNGCGHGTTETETRGEFRNVVGDEQFELESEGGIPAGNLFRGSQAEESLADGGGAGGDAFEIESGIVVAETPSGLAEGLAGIGVKPFVAGNESGLAEFFKESGKVAVADGVYGGGDFVWEQGAVGKGFEDGTPGVGGA